MAQGCSRTTAYSYANEYEQSLNEGKSDLEAHLSALKALDLDKMILGRNEYMQYIYDSSLDCGVGEYSATQFSDDAYNVWITAWDVYKYARDTGKTHQRACESASVACFSHFNSPGFTSKYDRRSAYIEQGMSSEIADQKLDEEESMLYELLKTWYESNGFEG